MPSSSTVGRRRSAGRWARLTAAAILGATVAFTCPSIDAGPTARFPDSDYDIPGPTGHAGPIVGTNYTHHAFAEDCSWDGGGILHTYAKPGVDALVHDQLREMRLSGVESLRLIVWHMRDVARQRWGVVPSRGGKLPSPYRESLIAYLTEVRRFGYRRLTVSFSPQWTNSPLRDNYDPATLDENWAFIRDVRNLVVQHGPDDVRFDLLNEGAPSGHLPEPQRVRMTRYVQRLWRRYVAAYGPDDATISVIAPETARDRGRRLENLLDALVADGQPLPGWFEIHVNYPSGGVARGLHHADSILRARGYPQPLTIGETSYNDAAVASTIRTHTEGSERPLDEVVQWFRRAGAECDVSPPYRADAYLALPGRSAPDHAPASTPAKSSSARARASASTSGLGSS